MSIELSFSDKLVFDDIDMIAPEVIVKQVSDQLSAATRGMIEGAVVPYKKAIESYATEDIFALTQRLGGTLTSSPQMHDIQDDLGKQGFQYNRFECYISATKLPNYKFRVFFFEYGVGGYPVKVVLEQSIADELFKGKNAKYIIWEKNRSDLEALVVAVFSSKKIIKIMQELINATLIAENMKAKSEEQDGNT